MADMSFDFSELNKLSADLGEVPKNAGKHIRKAVEVTSRKVKDAANDSVKSSRASWSKPLAGAIDYEITAEAGDGGSSITSEVGYNKTRYGKRASLGNLREFGAPNAPSGFFSGDKFIPIPGTSAPRAPHNDLQIALHANEADFVKGLEDALRDAEREAGL